MKITHSAHGAVACVALAAGLVFLWVSALLSVLVCRCVSHVPFHDLCHGKSHLSGFKLSELLRVVFLYPLLYL